MKILQALVIVLLSSSVFAIESNGDLKVKKEGNQVIILDFKDGDKIKLFEIATGDHILSKSDYMIDLSLLPNGKYKIVDNHGRTAEIEKTEQDIAIEEPPLGEDFMVEEDAPMYDMDEFNTAAELELYYYMLEFDPLMIEQAGNRVTILEYQAGDEIKVYEFQSKNHVLTKHEPILDLSLLPDGRYLLENNRKQIAVVQRMDVMEEEQPSEILIADF